MHSSEKRDGFILLVAIVCLPLVWLIGFGWRPGEMMMSGDAIQWLHRTYDLMAHGGDWKTLLFRADTLGGTVVLDVAGKSPLIDVAGWLGLSATATVNFVSIACQVMIAFFGARSTLDLASLWGGERKTEAGVITALVAVFAFSPSVATRFEAGHLDLLYGLMPFLFALSFLLSLRAGTITRTFAAVSFLALFCSYPTHGHQLKVYGLVFGFPLLLAATWSHENWKRTFSFVRENFRGIAFGALVTFGALALSMPRFVGMLKYAGSSDAVRSITGESMIFSYITSTWSDWWGSVPLHKGLTWTERDPNFIHETAFGLGPFLLVIPALLFAKRYVWATALAVAALAAMLFSMDTFVTDALVTLLPPLSQFRVPARAIMVLTYALPLVTMALLLSTVKDRWSVKGAAAAAAVVGIAALLDLDGREIVLWCFGFALLAGFAARRLISPKACTWLAAGPVVFVFAFGHLSSFRDWIPPLTNTEEALAKAMSVGREIKSREPYLKTDLDRIVTEAMDPVFGIQLPMAMQLSQLSGYAGPTRRFIRLFSLILNQDIHPSIVYIPIVEKMPNFALLQQLYNVKARLVPGGGGLRAEPLPPTIGSAWFSAGIAKFPSLKEALQDLSRKVSSGTPVIQALGERVYLDGSDEKSIELAGTNPACASARVDEVTEGNDRQSFNVKVSTPADCPLTLAMNYTELFRGKAIDGSGNERDLVVYPAYGPLLGTFVPAGTREVRIWAEPIVPTWAKVLGVVGALCFVIALLLARPVARREKA